MAERIVIVGAGAVGAYVGGYLSRAGEDVTLIDPWPEHVETMRQSGLTLSGLTEPECFNTPVKAMHITDVQSLPKDGPVDIAFICTKAYDTAWAATMIEQYMAPDGYAISLQNCINEHTIAKVFGEERTIGCIAAKIAVELHAPGAVRRGVPLGGDKHTVFRVGEMDEKQTPRIERVANMLSSIDSSKSTTNLWGERWSKLCANGMQNGVSAASGLGSNDKARDPDVRWLMIRLGGQGAKVGKALGLKLEKIGKFDAEDWITASEGNGETREMIEQQMVDEIEGRSEANRPSMGQDISKGRRTEIDAINGYIAARGKEVGIDTPAHSKLVEVVREVERGVKPPAPERLTGV